jgi:FkbM family methyltransferase
VASDGDFLRPPVSEQITFLRRGVHWTVPAWDEQIGRAIYASGGYDERRRNALLDEMRALSRLAPGRDLVLDIGANIGSHTLPFALQAGCRVLAIEPLPELFEMLIQNVRRNGIQTAVRCHQAAISRRPGIGELLVPATNGGGGELARPGRKPTFVASDRTKCVVEVVLQPLEAVLGEHNVDPDEVAFVWSDTQGCEAEVIASGGSLWEAGVPLYAEFWPYGLEQQSGAEDFIALAEGSFRSFIEASDLVAGRPVRKPLSVLRSLLCGTWWRAREEWHTDLLLLSEPPTPV